MADIRETLKAWIAIDDEIRVFQARIKELRERRKVSGEAVIEYMKTNQLDQFVLEGPGGNLNLSTRVSRPPLKRQNIRTQLMVQFADQPQRIAEALRAIEGIPEGGDMMSVSGTPRDVLSRRVPKSSRVATL